MDSTDQVIDTPLRVELESRYLAYALSTIISRSLPDVRDGLKPVHRRILFAMRALNLSSGTPFKKSARVVGDVIGKFHPHGDQAAYDAMVRLAQEFAVRYPLVDGQGNFGNIDGDGAAAMRYTEARLTRVAEALLEDLDLDTVGMSPTYDGSQEEPQVLPARFPNLLANGSSGIAVGMSTSIAPHNVGEILDACLLLIDDRAVPAETLMQVLPGPDFPTGGILAADEGERREVFNKGRGSLRLRCRWSVEELGRGAYRIVITEIPYQVPKSRLLERIGQLILSKKCPLISDVRDESDELVRIVIEPKSGRVDPDLIMAYLFKNTDLEIRFSANMNVVTASGRPEVLGVRDILLAWLDHRFEVHNRRAAHELGRIRDRLHLLSAYLIVHLNIDEVIAIIKAHDEPAPVLMARFLLDAVQAEAILNMRLRALRRLEEMTIRKEIADKELRAQELQGMLSDGALMWGEIRKELKQTRKEFADPRRTTIVATPKEVEIKPEDLVEKEPVTLIFSRMGWVKTVRMHGVDLSKVRFKEADALHLVVECYSTDVISFLTPGGKVYSQLADRFPPGKGFGEPWTIYFDTDPGELPMLVMAVDGGQEYFAATQLGQGLRVKGDDLVASQRKGKQVFTFNTDDVLLHMLPVRGEWVASVTSEARLLVCPLEQFPQLARGKGVRIQRFRKGERLVDVVTFAAGEGITLDNGKRQRALSFEDLAVWKGDRAGKGTMLPHGFMSGAVFVGTGVVPGVVIKGKTGSLFE